LCGLALPSIDQSQSVLVARNRHFHNTMCKEKILHRVKKLANSFGVNQNQREGEMNLWGFDATKEPHQKLEAA
jgi:hypothetical protein